MASSGEEKGSLGRSGSRPRRVSTAGDAAHDETSRYVIGNHGTSPDKSTLADGDAAENHRSRADGSAPAYDGRFQAPLIVGQQIARRTCCLGKPVVDEHHAVADEHLVFNRDALTDEGVA